MWRLVAVLAACASLVAAAQQVADPAKLPIDGNIEFLALSKPVKCKVEGSSDCTRCKAVCSNIQTCLATGVAKPSAVETWFGIITGGGSGAGVTCSAFDVQVQVPTAGSSSQPSQPGEFVVRSYQAGVSVNSPGTTTFVSTKTYNNSNVEGSVTAGCDGMTMRFFPGGFCNCELDFKVTKGNVLGVNAQQPAWSLEAAQAQKLGVIYANRVKLTPDMSTFKVRGVRGRGSRIGV